ncbi:hypothetical protein K3495_g1266 [Podosphaera aphanis]|nr:hypothetical protein K3495_g1266 [Podosphaera aphanis]
MANSTTDVQVREKSFKCLPVEFELFEEYVNSDWKKGIVSIDSAKSINGYLIYRIIYYQRAEIYDELLHQTYQEDFESWTKEDPNKGNCDIIRLFRDTLRKRGCFVASDRNTLPKNLELALNEWHEWTASEIEQQVKHGGFIPLSRYYVETKTSPIRSASPQPQSYGIKKEQPQQQSMPNRKSNASIYDQTLVSRQVTDLMKIHSDDYKKYSGERYDYLHKKLDIFYDFRGKTGLHRDNYSKALSIMLTGKASQFYYQYISGRNDLSLQQALDLIKRHFETPEVRQFYLNEWRNVTLQSIIDSNPEKPNLECFELMLDKLNKLQPGLSSSYRNEDVLRDQVLVACRGIPECSYSLFKPADSYEGVCADMRNAISTKADEQKHQFYQSRQFNNNDQGNSELYWTDRTYGRKPNFTHHRNSHRGNNNTRSLEHQRKKRCYVCNKTGCWSDKHPTSECKSAYERYRQSALITNIDPSTGGFQDFLVEFEGTELDLSENDEIQQLVTELEIEDVGENYFTEFGPIDGTSVITDLHDQSAFHVITGIDRFDPNRSLDDIETFMLNDCYSSSVFQGIMPDTGAADVLTAGLEQTKALQRQLSISIDKSNTGQHRIRFVKGETVSIGSINVPTPFGLVIFHVVPTKTPFLLCLKDMDALNIKFDNVENVTIQYGKKYPYSITIFHLTETELRRIHRRFGHPSVRKLSDLLLRADEEFDASILHKISKLCHQCQLHGRSPGRFRFNIRDDIQFNSEIVVDVMYLDNNRPVLHVVDTATAFQSARFLKSLDAKTTWDTLRLCWIDIYNGPPDLIVHDAGKNFVASEFKQNAQAPSIDVKQVPVEAHNSIGKVEQYHAPLKRAYEVIKAELPATTPPELVLSMAVKPVNDTVGPNGLVPTLLVFGAYPKISPTSPPSPPILARSEAIYALRMRNGPDVSKTLQLSPNDDVLVWREKDNWTGPFKILAIDGNKCTVDLPHGPTEFRSTAVKPYHTDDFAEKKPSEDNHSDNAEAIDVEEDEWTPLDYNPTEPVRRGRGRPKGLKNKNNLPAIQLNTSTSTPLGPPIYHAAMLSAKEQFDMSLSLQLRKEGKITTPGKPSETSDKTEIDALISNNVFRFEKFNPSKHGGIRIFKSRLVREVKGRATKQPYEKSRLVIQG